MSSFITRKEEMSFDMVKFDKVLNFYEEFDFF
jgi:hypothetical protein